MRSQCVRHAAQSCESVQCGIYCDLWKEGNNKMSRYSSTNSMVVSLTSKANKRGFQLSFRPCLHGVNRTCSGAFHIAISGNGVRKNNMTMSEVNDFLKDYPIISS